MTTTGGLVDCWFAVATSAEVGEAPTPVTLLETDYVLWRGDDGEITAVRDRCSHREARLSLGSVTNGCIQCPYHGWRYRGDGSAAEMSGNGIRCFAQAWIEHRGGVVPGTVAVATDAGLRTVEIRSHDGTTMVSSVEMGEVSDTHEPIDWAKTGCHPDRPVRHLSLGNPHAVVGVDDVAVVDLEGLGSVVPGVNLEIVEPGPGPHEVRMRVHERGVGITEACGTGACATAVAALEWGLVTADANGEVTVHMDGGTVTVAIDRAARTAVLSGPSVAIATVEIEPR